MNKNWMCTAVEYDDDWTPSKFYVIQGPCKKCGTKENSLVYMDFVQNSKDKSQSIFRTKCMSCWSEGIYFAGEMWK